jgi:hypothetical protein
MFDTFHVASAGVQVNDEGKREAETIEVGPYLVSVGNASGARETDSEF